MVVATAAAHSTPTASAARRHRRRLRADELLACAGAGLALFWPGTVGSSAYLIMVSACFVPVGVRTLLQLEAGLIPPPVPPAASPNAEPGRPDDGAIVRHTRTALALIDVTTEGTVVRRANPAFRTLCPGGFDPPSLFVPDDAVAVDSALERVRAGRFDVWDAATALSAPEEGGRIRWLQVGLTPLPEAATSGTWRVALSLTRIDPPAVPAPRKAVEESVEDTAEAAGLWSRPGGGWLEM
jgi:hypothetical protein